MLAAPFAYRNIAGASIQMTGWIVLTHFFNHQTHVPGQVTALLVQSGIDPAATDIVAMPGISLPAGAFPS